MHFVVTDFQFDNLLAWGNRFSSFALKLFELLEYVGGFAKCMALTAIVLPAVSLAAVVFFTQIISAYQRDGGPSR